MPRTLRARTGQAGLALAMLVLLAGGAPAHAEAGRVEDMPALGSITIEDDGLGPRATNSYEDPQHELWACETTLHSWVGGVATEVIVRCDPGQDVSFTCAEMVVSTTTRGGTAGGTVSCNTARTLDTGVFTGFAFSERHANLGHATEITCRAYVDDRTLVPPYTVTCADPGPPAIGAAP